MRGALPPPGPGCGGPGALQGAVYGAGDPVALGHRGGRVGPVRPGAYLGRSRYPARGRLGGPKERLRSALKSEPGAERDNQLVLALADEGTLLEDEPVAEWAVRPRERLEWDRQEARLALARDRGRGKGRSQPEAVIEAWASCLVHEPTSEEAASALIGVYGAQRRHALVDATYDRCRSGLEELGLRISPALKEVYAAATAATELLGSPEDPVPRSGSWYKEERRLVSVLFAELSGPVGVGVMSDPEDVRQVLGGALAGVIAEVEGLGGTVTSVSGAGLAALFGAPAAHEDDPEPRCGPGLAYCRRSAPAACPLAQERSRPALVSRPAPRWLAPSWPGLVTERWERWSVRRRLCSRRPERARSWWRWSPAPPPRGPSSGARQKMLPPPRGPSRLSLPISSGPGHDRPATEAAPGWRAALPGGPSGRAGHARRGVARSHVRDGLGRLSGGRAGLGQDPLGAGMP